MKINFEKEFQTWDQLLKRIENYRTLYLQYLNRDKIGVPPPMEHPLIEKIVILNENPELGDNWEVELKKLLEDKISDILNNCAKNFNFDSIDEAATYLTSSNPKFVAQAKKLTEFRDTVWTLYESKNKWDNEEFFSALAHIEISFDDTPT
jgi:hypothetical protein